MIYFFNHAIIFSLIDISPLKVDLSNLSVTLLIFFIPEVIHQEVSLFRCSCWVESFHLYASMRNPFTSSCLLLVGSLKNLDQLCVLVSSVLPTTHHNITDRILDMTKTLNK